jgi:hypothetical protein
MSEATFNPFDANGYVAESATQTQQPAAEPVTTEPAQSEPVTSTAEPQQTTATEPTTVEPQTSEPAKAEPSKNDVQQPEVKPFEWNNDFAKTVYDKLVSKDISELADMLYEQKVLSNLDSMSDEDVVKLHMAYQYPDLTPDEIEEEFNAKYKVENRIDEDSMTEDEIAQARRQMEKEQKSLNRELKKLVREAKDGLSDMKKDIDFPDILSQIQQASQQPVSDDAISQILAKQQEEQQAAYLEARNVFVQSIEDGLKNFDGFSVNYKDEDVQFDGKYNLTQEDKAALQGTLKDFDLEGFYGNRYFKDGRYDTKQLAEDVYFLQNRDKIVNAMVTQAVSKAKADILKNMKNIDYSNQPRPSTAANMSDYDEMVNTMFRL